MNQKSEPITNIENKKLPGQDKIKYPFQQPSNRSSIPMIAGILLIISGVIAILYWIFVIVNVDLFTSMMDISYFQSIDPDITIEDIKETLVLCGTIFSIVAIFPILGGILSLKRKLWGVSIACSVIGLFSMGILFMSSILSFIALILLIISRQEFQ